MARLLYFTDPMCSWCWGFAPVVRQLRDEGGHQIEVAVGGLRAGEKRGMTAELRDYVLHHWQQVAATTGAVFRFEDALPEGFVYNTEPACRALVAMRQLMPASSLEYLHTLQAAFYADGEDITQADSLARLATTQGVEQETFVETWESDAIRLATQSDFERKDQYGVMGFPCLLLDTGERMRLLTMGYQPLAVVEQQIQRRLASARDTTLH